MRKSLTKICLLCSFILSLVFAVSFSSLIQVNATEPTVTYDTATVYDLWDIAKTTDFISNASDNRNIGQMPDTQNVAFRAKFSYDESNTSKILIINFLMGQDSSINSKYFLQNNGYMFYFRDNTARLVYQGDGTETNQLTNTAVSLGWSELEKKLPTITNLDGTGKINANDWRYGRESFIFEMGYVKAYTDGEWTGNKVYVKINDVELMSFTDTSEYYKNKGTYFGKGATGYGYTNYTFSTTYNFAHITMANAPEGAAFTSGSVHDVIIADGATLEIPVEDGYKVTSAKLGETDVTDKLTWSVGKYILDCSGLADGTYNLEVEISKCEIKIDDVKVYDLYDLKGVKEHQPTKANDETQNVGKFDSNMNVAFRAKISHTDGQNHAFAMNYIILKTASGSHFANGGYGYQFYLRDNAMSIRYDSNPTTDNDSSEIVTAVKVSDISSDILGGTKEDFFKGKIEFTFEFGCAKYYVDGEYVANYVYVKINGTEVMHFIDNGANFTGAADLGLYTGRGADLREYCQYKFLTAYDSIKIVMGKVSEGADFVEGATYDILAVAGAELILPLKFGYKLEKAMLDETDVTNFVKESEGKYVLDCSKLTSGGTLTVTTVLNEATVTVTPNENVTVETAEKCDYTSYLNAKITTAVGYTLSSLKINGIEQIENVTLGADGVYTVEYQVLEDITIVTEVEQTNYSVTVNKTGDGTVEVESTVGAFDKITVKFKPNDGAYIKGSVTLNGEKILLDGNNEYVVEKVMSDLIINVEFSVVETVDKTNETTSKGCGSFIDGGCIILAAITLAAASIMFIIKRKKI